MNFSKYWRDNKRVIFPVIKIDGTIIEQVQTFKYLGVIIDLNLRFSEHRNSCVRNALSKFHLLGKIREFMLTSTAVVLYKTMILPYLEFGSVFLLNRCDADIERLQKTQNRCLRFIFRVDRLYSTAQLHMHARLETWKVRALTAAMKMMFKYKFSPDNLREVNDDNRALTRTSSGPIFKIDQPNSSFLKSTAYLLRKEWNELPVRIRTIDDPEHFKMVIKRYMRGEYYDDLNPVNLASEGSGNPSTHHIDVNE